MISRAALALLLLMVIPTYALAQSPLPKEGSGTQTAYFTGTVKVLPVGQDLYMITYDVLSVLTNDAGQGFLHNVSERCVGAHSAVKGDFDDEHGACVAIDRDGDQVFLRYTGAGRRGEAAKLKGNYVGGTGKYARLTGSFEFARTSLRPTMEGTAHAFMKGTYTYKLP